MARHDFTLTVGGQLTDEVLDALCEAGCGDATFSAGGGRVVGVFHREAPSLSEATASAVRAVDSVEGLVVLYVGPGLER